MKQRKYDLFIVGNGFDIACNYKTTYEDFLKSGNSYNSKLFTCFQNTDDLNAFCNSEWNGFEKMLCHYLCFIKYLFSNQNIKKRIFR